MDIKVYAINYPTDTDEQDGHGPYNSEAYLIKSISERKSKNVKVRYSTILCTGQPKVGKTTFCHLLMNQDTPPPGKGDFYKIFIKTKGQFIWTEVDMKHLSTLIDQANKMNESNDLQELMNPSTNESTSAAMPVTITRDEILDILILVDINVPTPTVSLLPPALVTFVTYKLSGKEDHVCTKTCAFIKELMSSYCFTATDAPKFNELEIDSDFDKDFYTSFIGTLSDVDDGSSESVYSKEAALVDEKLQDLESCINCSAMPLSFWYLKKDSYLPIVNLINSQEKNFKNVKDKLKKTVELHTAFKIPITWILLSLKVLQGCFEDKAPSTDTEQSRAQYLEYKEVKKIWVTECKMPHESRQELKLALQFFHHNGVLFHFNAVEEAKDYVFANCSWMFDQLKHLFSGFKEEGTDHSAKELLEKEGRIKLKSKILREINFKGPGKMTFEAFLKLLIYLKFIAKVKIDEEEMYFMPSILEPYGSDENFFNRYGSKCHDPLLITFSSGSMHRSFFCLLSAYILNHLPKGWSKLVYNNQKKRQHTFKDLVTFSIEGGYYVCIIDNVFSLEVRMYSKSQICNPELHIDVHGIVEKALEDVCRNVEIPYKECKYGFLCSKCGSNDHMMTLEGNLDYSARCSKGEGLQPLSPSQGVWLKVSFNLLYFVFTICYWSTDLCHLLGTNSSTGFIRT